MRVQLRANRQWYGSVQFLILKLLKNWSSKGLDLVLTDTTLDKLPLPKTALPLPNYANCNRMMIDDDDDDDDAFGNNI